MRLVEILQLAGMATAVLAGLTIRVERRILARLRRHHATSPEHALPLTGLGLVARRRLARLRAAAAVREAAPALWYLDESAYAAMRRRRRRRALLLAAAAVVATTVTLLVLERVGRG